jgi:subtilisin family serine protease
VDDDANGFVDDLNGWDFIDGDAVPQDLDSHGTHVAGTIAAAMDGQGVVGVCPGCRIMALRFDLDVFTEVQALDYAIANGASVVNGSFGGGFFSKTERKALQRAIDAGILLVFAAGNDAANQDMFLVGPSGNQVAPSYPAAHDLAGIVSVAASDHGDEFGQFTGCDLDTGGDPICDFSNLGHDSVDLAAPGVGVLSTIPGNNYAWFDGTSMAAPHVAGVAGLVKSLHPTYTPLELRNALLNSVDLPAPLGGGFILTDGRVNAATALNASTATTFPTSIGNISTASGINKKKTGRLSYPSNVNDVFRKNLHKGDRYVVTLEVPKGKDFDLFIYKPGTLGIFQVTGIVGFGARGKGKDEVVVLTARKNGVYYFQASSFFSTGRYVLRVDRA